MNDLVSPLRIGGLACLLGLSMNGQAHATDAAELVKQLESPSSDERASAAKALRELIAKDPTSRTNDHGREYWQGRIAKVKLGMNREEVLRLLPLDDSKQRDESMICSGRSCNAQWRLDDYWQAQIAYKINPNDDDTKVFPDDLNLTVLVLPTLHERAKSKWVPPSERYTGVWTGWHVNGQKAIEAEYQNGKYHGVFASFHDNGARGTTQEYRAGKADGPGFGWDREGRRSYEITYLDGQQSGVWTHWWPNGKPHSRRTYMNGKNDGLHETWTETGKLRYRDNYRDGERHGLSEAWDEQGKSLWSRNYRDDELISNR